MNVEFRKSFEKDLDKIREQDLLERIKVLIQEVENAESLLGISNIKKLNTGGDYYRIRVGDYRIGITQDEDVITFVRILHRREIYRYFP